MSEFEVYVFRETPGSPIQPIQPLGTILAPRKRPHDFELPKEKVNWSVERDLVAGKTGGRMISEILEQGKARARSPVNKTTQEWHRNKFFEKTLTTGAVSKAFQLTLPARFIKLYADKIRNYVVLQSVKDRKAYTVKLYIKHPDKRRRPELLQFVFDRGGWRDFVLFKGLIVGDRLRFTLVDMSKFEVVILHSGGQNSQIVRLSVQGPGIRSKDSASSAICQPATKSLGPQVHVDLTAECSMKKERESNSDLQFAEKVNSEGSDGEHSASDFSPRWTPMSLRDGIKESNVQGLSTSFNHTDFMTKAEMHK
ncbi:hypothetical protein M758_6G082500 [Ceratodon purpureus]|nr:hypothetical protein M758_6G082500 [Ceratodon purpureus]